MPLGVANDEEPELNRMVGTTGKYGFRAGASEVADAEGAKQRQHYCGQQDHQPGALGFE